MGIFDRDYMKRRDDGSSGPDVGRASRVLWIGLAVLVLIVVIASVLTPPKTLPLKEGSQLVNINTATPEELESLPSIGPSLAQLVIAGRPYKDVADLARIRGISERQVEQLRPMLTVSEPTRDLPAVSVRERIAAWAAALSPSALAGWGIGALVATFFFFQWLRRMRRRWRNARTRAAFEDAERKRWEGHKRE